jgi:putative ABC transport system permease protein
MSRQSELTVRTSLGASPLRLVRQLVVEGICLGSIGGVIGALLAVWGTRVASHWFRLEGSGIPLRIDHRVLAFGAGAAVLVGILTALLPSTWAARWNLQNALGDRSGSTLRPRLRQVTAVLLVTQIASGLVLLTGAGVLSSEFLKLRYLRLGFDPANLYQVSLFGSRELREAPEPWRPTLEEARRRVASIPGVESAALVHVSAIHPSVVRAEGSADNATRETQTARVQAVDASYFETYATTILDGSAFTAADRRGGRPVCVINAAAAAAFWTGERSLGRQVFIGDSTGGEWLTVVGVVANLEQGEMAERQWPMVYRPLDQAPLYHPAASLAVRLTGRGETNLAALQKAVAEALGHPVSAFGPVAADLDRRFLTQRFNALALDIFALFALLLAAIGIYGSVAYAVARRTREIGVRVALGAQRSRVLRLVTGRTMWVVLAGLLLGVVGSLVLTRALRVFASATSTSDPRMFAAAALLVSLVALIATYLPASRATAVDPLIALRNE